VVKHELRNRVGRVSYLPNSTAGKKLALRFHQDAAVNANLRLQGLCPIHNPSSDALPLRFQHQIVSKRKGFKLGAKDHR
jgi:hypothetical protein